MAVTTHAIATADDSNGSSYVSGAFTPAADDLLLVSISAAATTAVGTVTSSVAGKTFTKITSATRSNGGSTVYMFVADQLASNESQTVTFDCTGDAAAGAVIVVCRVSGITRTGLDAILQSAVANDADPSVDTDIVFGANVQTANPTVGAFGSFDPNASTPPTNWTTLGGDSGTAPTNRCQTVSRDSGFTGTTITWPAGGTSQRGIVFAEVDTSAAGGGAAEHRPLMMMGVG